MARYDSTKVEHAIAQAVAELRISGLNHDEAALELGQLFEEAWEQASGAPVLNAKGSPAGFASSLFGLSRTTSHERDPTSELRKLNEKIDSRYDHLEALNRAEIVDKDEIRSTWAQIQELEALEAKEFRLRFEESLAAPIDAGARLLDQARALRKRLEAITARNSCARPADDKTSLAWES